MKKTQLLTVTRADSYDGGKVAKVALTGKWLLPLGFEPGSLVQAIPAPNGMDFFLTKEESTRCPIEGKLLHVMQICDKRWGSYPALMTVGSFLDQCGLSYGNRCIVHCEYGKIQIRRLDLATLGFPENEHTHVFLVGSSTGQYHETVPTISLSGKWLMEYGFIRDSCVSIETKPEGILLDLQEEEKDYSQLVKLARDRKMTLIRVKMRRDNPQIKISGTMLKRARMATEDAFAICCQYGHMELYKLDLERFAFS